LPVRVTPKTRPGAWVALDAPNPVRATEDITPREPGESRIGFARAGVPHLVVLCEDVGSIEVGRRGAQLRAATGHRPDGANVNFVSPGNGSTWRIRTFERGVEAETLACGTGAVATGIMLMEWQCVTGPVSLESASGSVVLVEPSEGRVRLWGEGRRVYDGVLREVVAATA
jgi:diaminopimelate epimerase